MTEIDRAGQFRPPSSPPGWPRSRRPSGRGPTSCPGPGSCSARGSADWPTTSPDTVAIPFAELPGWPAATAPGHLGRLLLGRLDGVPVAMLQGRFHMYEGNDPGLVVQPVLLMGRLGASNRRPDECRRWPEPGLRRRHADGHLPITST